MRRYQLGAHTKIEAKVHLIWIPKYRKKVLTKQIAIRVRNILRQITIEHEIQIISGKVAKDVRSFFRRDGFLIPLEILKLYSGNSTAPTSLFS